MRRSEPELVHWHGLFIPPEVDGSAEEGTPPVPPSAGSDISSRCAAIRDARWYHSHTYAGRNLHRGGYTGQFGFLQIVPKQDPARYDREVLLALHGWDPFPHYRGDGWRWRRGFPRSKLQITYRQQPYVRRWRAGSGTRGGTRTLSHSQRQRDGGASARAAQPSIHCSCTRWQRESGAARSGDARSCAGGAYRRELWR